MVTQLLIHGVLLAVIGYIFYQLVVVRYIEYRRDSEIGRQHGCELPPELSKRWPLGIDRIRELWTYNADGRLLAFLCSVAKDYEPGNSLYQYLLFGPRTFHVLRPENVEAILSTNFKDYGFGSRSAVFAPLLGNGIFTQEGPSWKHSRELLRKQFARVQSRNLIHFHEHVDNLIARVPSDGVVDLQPLFFDLTLDMATALLFGKSVYSLRTKAGQNTRNKAFAENFDMAQPRGFGQKISYRALAFPLQPTRVSKGLLDLDENTYLDKKPDGFIEQVALESATKVSLRDQLLNVLLSGRDTTACCLAWTFRLLVRHEQAMCRLRREVSSIMGDSPHATREQIKKMPYLAYVIKESLRLYPPVPLNNREAIRTTILPTGGGPNADKPMLIRKGELVVFSQYVNSRKKNIYGLDADEFRPERWETGELAHIGWAYFPFNGGPRQCLGEDFALMEVSYMVVRLLQTFPTISLPKGDLVEAVGSER
ncbi:n-alkane-inducible cytochrome P450 [Aspergillus campestris IBT 28561]|uniref:N-alkane-inducible cytochrome P450 n=1 Tax=Aspergillus campestris (strain IBT 28561) TaxID=1392248 RepID=A0A2I1CVE4_ASPC2|nr:n-alkane-inducible cytochrome P450 [Aspergillus campestris IBT 28561]PKY01585.1 n-alkane-inducible cytochrome P450 [Aspergillus campestris IBT 28561]